MNLLTDMTQFSAQYTAWQQLSDSAAAASELRPRPQLAVHFDLATREWCGAQVRMLYFGAWSNDAKYASGN